MIWSLFAIVVLLVAAAAWVGVRAVLAAGHLRDAQQAASRLTSSISDPAAAAGVVGRLMKETGAAHDLTGDPVWAAAMGVPWVGEQLAAVRTAIVAVDDVVTEAIAPLATPNGLSVAALQPVDGRFDLDAIAAMHDPAVSAAAATAAAAESVDSIRTSALLSPLADEVVRLQELVGTARTTTDALSRVTELMPAMLGAEGPRNYLVLFQNLAEWRSLGGIVGATALVHAEGGGMELADQRAANDMTRWPESVIPMGPELDAIYDQKPGRYMQNVTQVPSFPLGAQLAQEMWARETGTRVDGVVAFDPVALSYLLRATGPIELATGDLLTSENAIQLLLNEVYLRYPSPADQDAFFQSATAQIFAALTSGRADTAELIGALAQAGAERRILMWNAVPEEQAVLDGTSLQGHLPTTDAERTTFGVYLNEGASSKINYYTKIDTGVSWCTDTEGSPDAALSLRIRSELPGDASLPPYIVGSGSYGVPPSITRTVTYLYLPAGSELASASSEGPGSPGFATGSDGEYTVLTWTTDLAPGEEATAAVRVRTPQTPVLAAEVTPVIPGSAGEIPAACTPAS